jgi:nucleotide sugar dehydrogenase
MKLGIIGNGFVGNAIYEGLMQDYRVIVYDKDQSRSNNTIEEINETNIIFLCVPTPMNQDGAFDLSILEEAILNLEQNKILIIKSTITPEAAQQLIELFPNQSFVFNPEFLTERTAIEDFKNLTRIVLGGDLEKVNEVQEIYKKVFPNVTYIKTDYKTACFIKYFCNCFFAVKVSIMNEFKQIADQEGADWDVALEGLLASDWVNPMHTQVPGPDGDFGFGGKCFPKDLNAFIEYSNSLGIEPSMLKASWNKNIEVRKNKNWLQIKGAVSNTNRSKK